MAGLLPLYAARPGPLGAVAGSPVVGASGSGRARPEPTGAAARVACRDPPVRQRCGRWSTRRSGTAWPPTSRLAGPQLRAPLLTRKRKEMNTTAAKTTTSASPKEPQLVEDHRPRVQEDDLDVEDDEDHGDQVEADRKPGRRLDARDDAALVGRGLRRGRPLPRGQQGRGHEREGGEQESEDEEDQDGKIIVHRDLFLPRSPPCKAHRRSRAGRRRYRAAAGRAVPARAAPTIGAVSPADHSRIPPPADRPRRPPHRPGGRAGPRPRCPGGGRRALGLVVRLLAGRGGLGRGPGGEEGLPPGEDLR